ncbi:MAG: thiamine pyrophosphate-dependent enzyme [Candidatus Nealsonbacteria bacterium]|nr:thiamine pyrophosphate-dependent enzyme [Candidatus Nealsonbacteria bacterium]
MQELLDKNPGRKILLGNEAICRGALESGVQFVSTYPGTPASEIGNIFFDLTRERNGKGLYFEFSTNEKVAMEAGMGASFSGLKTLIAMKNFGLNVCIDSLLPFVYAGTKGPTVIIVADDPSCHSSAQSEENTRPIAFLAHIPILEPSDPQECKDFVKLGFKISEQFKIPIIIRTTTRVAHQKMPVVLDKMERSNEKIVGRFVKNPRQFITLPPRVLEMKKELLEKIVKIKSFSEKSSLNKIEKSSGPYKIGIITSGISYLYTKEALAEFNVSFPVLKLGFFYPLPELKIKKFIKGLKKVLIVEELEPFLEQEVERLAKESNCKLEVIGKKMITEIGEMRPEFVFSAVAKLSGEKYSQPKNTLQISIPKRLPQLCPGCPYWSVISAVKKAVNPEEVIFGGEIGCYMLFGNPPVNMQDYLFCMGSSMGIGHGIKKATGQKLIAFIGDSSFFHSGIPALINTVFNKSNPLIIILNNETTAMTGHQPHPVSVGSDTGIKIENIVRACGVKNAKTIDPTTNQEEMIETIKDFLSKDDVSVIIANHPCKFVAKK